jgi:hypothetical protein
VSASAGRTTAGPALATVAQPSSVRSSNVTEVRAKVSRTRANISASASSPPSTLPARFARVRDSAAARAACRVRRAAWSTVELTSAATRMKTSRARALLVSLMVKVCSGGVKK